MYEICVDGEIIYNPRLSKPNYLVLNPKLTLEVNKAGSLTFLLPPGNVKYDSIQKLKGVVTVTQDGEEIFRGRVLHDEKNFQNCKDVYCEGELSFLLDSIQRPYTFSGTVAELFKQLVTTHNKQVDDWKQFKIGSISDKFKSTHVDLEKTDYSKTFDHLSDVLIKDYGGYLRPRLKDGVRYLDYVDKYGKDSSQTIQFGVNLLDISEYINAENVFTVLIPLGKDGLTISNASGYYGKDYIEDEVGISLFGRIWKTHEFPEETDPTMLAAKGKAYLEAGIEMAVSLAIKAVDLNTINVDTERINLGDSVPVLSPPHGLNKKFECSKKVIDLVSPDKTEFTLGTTYTTLTEKQTGDSKVVLNTVSAAQAATNKANQAANAADKVASSMSQEGVFRLLTNNGKTQGMILDEATGNIYINASYIKSGMLTLGGDNATLKILDKDGVECVTATDSGIKILKGEVNATSGSLDSMTIVEGIDITSKTHPEIERVPFVTVSEFDNGFGTSLGVMLGAGTQRSAPLLLKASTIGLQGFSGLTFSADNIIFKNNFEGLGAYLDNIYLKNALHFDRSDSEKQIFFKTQTSGGTYQHNAKIYGGNASSKVALAAYDYKNSMRIIAYDDVDKQLVSDVTKIFFGNNSDEQKNIYFYSTDTAKNHHKCKIYGGEGDSTTGIGLHDIKNARDIWVYNDVDNIVKSESRLQYIVPTVTFLSNGAAAITNNSVVFPFLKMCFFRARFNVTAIPAGQLVEIGTLDSTYAPDGVATSMSVYVNNTAVTDASVRITTAGNIGIKSGTAIPTGTAIYLMGCWTY